MEPHNHIDVETLLKDLHISHSPDDISQLKANIAYLDEKGLSKINTRLMSQNKSLQFLDTLTEHNFTANLLKNLSDHESLKITYEPNDSEITRPPDLHIIFDNVIYWIQIKRLSRLELDNRQNKFFDEIERQAKEIKINKFFNLILTENFTYENIKELIEFLGCKAAVAIDNIEYELICDNKSKAIISFCTPVTAKKEGLTLGAYGNLDMVNITGLSEEQIKNGFRKAAGAFQCASTPTGINIIVAECNNPNSQAIDFCEALYGTEYSMISTISKNHIVCRRPNGLFGEIDFAQKVSGVIAIFRKNQTLMSEHSQVLCVNPKLYPLTEFISKLIKIDKTVDSKYLPKENFFR